MNSPGFKTCGNKGFHIMFENGVTLSTQFGPGDYCCNHDEPWDIDQKKDSWSSPDAEIALWKPTGAWITRDIVKMALGEQIDDDVFGRISPKDWLRVVICAAQYITPESEK